MKQDAVNFMTHRVVESQPGGWAATLVIGDLAQWKAKGRIPPDLEGFHFVDIAAVNPAFIRDLDPTVIFSSLVCRRFDALEIARMLGDMDYDGSYRVLTNDTPDTDLVVAEVKQIAPLLDFDVIDLSILFGDF